MIAIKAFIEQVIYVAIIAIIIELILPKGNTKKYIYIILSLFVLLNVISPIIDVVKDTNMQTVLDNVLETVSGNAESIDNVDVKEFSEYKNEKVTEKLEEELSYEIKEKLSSINIKFKDLRVKLSDQYNFEELEIKIGNLNSLGNRKVEKISNAISMISKEYNISENVITIIEEGE